jgi:hypothetical protein
LATGFLWSVTCQQHWIPPIARVVERTVKAESEADRAPRPIQFLCAPTQNFDAFIRSNRRSQKIRMRLGSSSDPFGPIPESPRGKDTAERRQVTVMFSDLVGSTALSARWTLKTFVNARSSA